MTDKNTGGTAFPYGNSTVGGEKGMTLRDYFAAKAMQGFMSATLGQSPTLIADRAYAVADAMLEAREK